MPRPAADKLLGAGVHDFHRPPRFQRQRGDSIFKVHPLLIAETAADARLNDADFADRHLQNAG